MTEYIEAPLMTAEEAAAITVDAEHIAEALPRVMAEHGVAMKLSAGRSFFPGTQDRVHLYVYSNSELERILF